MPRKASFSKEEVVAKALHIVRYKGLDSLTARSLGAALGSSSSPIFTLFSSMEEVVDEVCKAAIREFNDYVADVTDYVPAFKEFGMRLMRYARQEANLFHLLFIQRGVNVIDVQPQLQQCLIEMEKEYQITAEQTEMLFQQLWIFACGLTVQIGQGGSYLDEVQLGRMMSVQFMSTLMFLKSGRPAVNVPTRRRTEGDTMTMKL